MVYDYTLKLESMNKWYGPLVRELGIEAAVQTGWPSNDTCFLTTPDMPCTGRWVEELGTGGVIVRFPEESALPTDR